MMASVTSAKSCNSTSSSCCQVSPSALFQEKASRNKRKFRADPPLSDTSKSLSMPQIDCASYEFSAEKFEIMTGQGLAAPCDACDHKDYPDGLKLDLELSSATVASEVGPRRNKEEVEADEFQDADWSDFTESQLEELVFSNLDTIFKSAIKKIVACGYTEEVATNAVLRSGLCYGCKDIVSNIVDNTLAYLRNGVEIDHPGREQYFTDLKQLEMYVLAELVCVLREVRPFFSTGDAMWCLLICDMNVSHACAMDADPLNGFGGDGGPIASSSISNESPIRSDVKGSETTLSNSCNAVPAVPCVHNYESNEPTVGVHQNLSQPESSPLQNISGESVSNSLVTVNKSSAFAAASLAPTLEEKFVSKRVHGGSKRDYALRQKSLHLEKHYRTYGSKGSSRAAKLGSLGGLMDKKLKSMADSASKSASLKTNKAAAINVAQGNSHGSLSKSSESPSPAVFNLENASTVLEDSRTKISLNSPVAGGPAVGSELVNPPPFSATNPDLSLSLTTKCNLVPVPTSCNAERSDFNFAEIPYDRISGHWVPRDKKEELILKVVPKLHELQNQLQEWTEWANQKVMQAARRLSKDKAELKALKQEREEVERLKKEKQALEENTMKKLSEMENALCKASGQVERANSAVRRLEVENAALRQEMETAKLRAAESAANCQEVSKREKKTRMKLQSWEKEKSMLQEELVTEKHRFAQLKQDVDQAKDLCHQREARWKQEEKVKEDSLVQAILLRKEREQIEASTKSKEQLTKSDAENTSQKYKEDIQRLEKEISQLRLKADSSKIAALWRGIDGSYASMLSNPGKGLHNMPQDSPMPEGVDFQEYMGVGVRRERECVMCLSEEMSVVFLPCAHQVVCSTCNELHERQGMKDCPSCRSPIQRRISVRFPPARS